MKKTLTLVTWSVLSVLLSVSCTSKASSSSAASKPSDLATVILSSPLITLKKGQTVELSPSKVENFIQLVVLYNVEQSRWLADFQSAVSNMNGSISNTSDFQMTFLSNKKSAFFSGYGITASVFENFSQANYQSVYTFLNKNPDYKRLYDESSMLLEQSDLMNQSDMSGQ